MVEYYLKVGRASDLKDKKERMIFRLLEILPGAISWGTLILLIFLSWLKPLWVAIFIIGFDFYWLLKVVYLSSHTRAAFRKMRKHEKINWIEKLNRLGAEKYSIPVKSWAEIYHLIVIPAYKEPIGVIKESLRSIVDCDYPRDKMIVVLSYEQRAGEAAEGVAKEMEKEFKNNFFKFLITCHPDNLAGEIPGKGSNETWGARRVKELIIDPLKIPYENIIVSCFDADTIVFPKYFSCLTYHYLTTKNPTRTSFKPIPLFINNIWQTPALSRVMSFHDTFWHTMNQERPEKQITFSSHSMSFKALVEIDFWQTNVISEDSRIFWQCHLFYNGDYRVESLYYPVSMDANVAPTFWQTMVNLYKQQRRWAYGVGDISYFIFGFLKNKKISLNKKIFPGIWLIEGHWSWATNPLMILLLGWLPLVLGASHFGQSMLSYNLPQITRYILTAAMVGIIFSSYLSILLLPPRPPKYGRWKYIFFVLQWFLVPINMIFFGSFPAFEAQTRWMIGKYLGFWHTPKLRK